MTLNPAHCPLCGQANRCAMEIERATGQKQDACWCTGVSFSAELLARVPAASQHRPVFAPNALRWALNLTHFPLKRIRQTPRISL